MSSYATPPEAPIAAGAGLERAPTRPEDPYRALDDLMAAIEALCPVWPQRPIFSDMPLMRL